MWATNPNATTPDLGFEGHYWLPITNTNTNGYECRDCGAYVSYHILLSVTRGGASVILHACPTPQAAPVAPNPSAGVVVTQQHANVLTASNYFDALKAAFPREWTNAVVTPSTAPPKCDCGAAKALGIAPYALGHAHYCSVAEGK